MNLKHFYILLKRLNCILVQQTPFSFSVVRISSIPLFPKVKLATVILLSLRWTCHPDYRRDAHSYVASVRKYSRYI